MARITRRILLAAPALLPALAGAQGFPIRPITWVVPFAAGGITDTSARTLAQRMSQSLNQSVLVENRPGAGGTIGSEAVARSAADGYTMLYGSQGPIAAAPAMFPGLRYDPQRDLAACRVWVCWRWVGWIVDQAAGRRRLSLRQL